MKRCFGAVKCSQLVEYVLDYSLYAVNSEFTEQDHSVSDLRRGTLISSELGQQLCLYQTEART